MTKRSFIFRVQMVIVPVIVSMILSCSTSAQSITSVHVYAQPLLFGGFSFYLDQEGRFVHQDIRPAGQASTNTESFFVEYRYTEQNQQKAFQAFIKDIKISRLRSYREDQRSGVPEELHISIDVALSDGSVLELKMWANDKSPTIVPILESMTAFIKDHCESQHKPPAQVFLGSYIDPETVESAFATKAQP